MPTDLAAFRFPPLPDGRFELVSGADAVRQALWSLLSTEPGERVGRPTYGSGLRSFLYSPNSVETRARIRERLVQAIRRWEPRAQVTACAVEADPDRPSVIRVTLGYALTSDPGEDLALRAAFDLQGGAS